MITDSFSDRVFSSLDEKATTDGQKEIIKMIIKKHGYNDEPELINFIDENDNYDSFLVEIKDHGLCIKISFDQVWIDYDFLILSGIQDLNISPTPIEKGKLTGLSKDIYYTIQTFEYSENLKSIGVSLLMNPLYSDFFNKLKKLHNTTIPLYASEHVDDIKSYLDFHKQNFEYIQTYIEPEEVHEYELSKKIYEQVYDQMMKCVNENIEKIKDTNLVHGNLDASTIICNNFNFKFINFENSFRGSMFFDLANIVFELKINGIHEYEFITKSIKNYYPNVTNSTIHSHLEEYKICKKIWTYKMFLDLVKIYFKEVLVLNHIRKDKILQLANDFSKNFYDFDKNIAIFPEYKSFFVEKLNLLLTNV